MQSGAAAWARLKTLVDEARHGGLAALVPEQLIELHEGYRRAAADLAYAQTHFPRSASLTELNALVAAAHGFLYAAPPRRLARIGHFYAAEVPRLVRRHLGAVSLAAALLLGGAAAGALASAVDPALGRTLLPAQYRDVVGERVEQQGAAAGMPAAVGPLLSTAIMVNNIRVSFLAFAGGIVAGTLTVYVLLTNGLLFGALSGLFARAGLTLPFLALVVPHGSLELPAIGLAAAAGLVIAGAIVDPADQPRRQTVREAANTGVRLLLGTVPLFALAALIEGFVTPMDAPAPVKLAFGALLLAALLAWLTLGGREPAR